MPLQLTDPFQATPLVFSLASAQWLVDTRRVQPQPQGLLGFLKPHPNPSTAVPEDLKAQGFDPYKQARSRDAELLAQALEVISHPKSKVVFFEVAPGGEPTRYPFFLADGNACLAWFDEAAFYVSPAVPVLTLSSGLSHKLTHEKPRSAPFVLLPEALQVLAAAFRGPDGRLQRRERATLETALGGPAAVETLVAADVLKATADTLEAAEGYALALEATWSKHFLHIEVSHFSSTPPEVKQLMFLGPPKRRVWTEDVELEGRTCSVMRLLDPASASEIASALLS